MVLKLILKKFILSQLYPSQLTKPSCKSCLGSLINYLGKFIPNLSIKSVNLSKFFEKDNRSFLILLKFMLLID